MDKLLNINVICQQLPLEVLMSYCRCLEHSDVSFRVIIIGKLAQLAFADRTASQIEEIDDMIAILYKRQNIRNSVQQQITKQISTIERIKKESGL